MAKRLVLQEAMDTTYLAMLLMKRYIPCQAKIILTIWMLFIKFPKGNTRNRWGHDNQRSYIGYEEHMDGFFNFELER